MQHDGCGESSACSSRQSNRTNGGYNADCSSLSNFSDFSSLSLDVPTGINLDAPYKTRSCKRQFDVLSVSRWKKYESVEQAVGFAPPLMESSKKTLQDGGKNHRVTIATNQGPKQIPLPHEFFLPTKICDLKKITDVADDSAVSPLGNSLDRFGGSTSRDTDCSITSASKNNFPLESAVNTNGDGDANLCNKKETDISRILPNWKNLRVVNPIDPRIDLSSVSLVHASTLHARSTQNDSTTAKGDTEVTHLAPNQQGYLRLLESCLPFFNAYTSSSEQPTSNGDMKAAATKKALEIGEFMLKCLESDGTFSSLASSEADTNIDATSMFALPRANHKPAFQNLSSSASSDGHDFSQVDNSEAGGLDQEIQEQLQHHDHQEQILQGPPIVSDSMAFSSANNGTSNGSGGSGNDTSRAHKEAGSNSLKSKFCEDFIDEDTRLRNLEKNSVFNHARERIADNSNGNLKEGQTHNSQLANCKVSHQNNCHHLAISSTGGENAADIIATTSHSRLAMKKRKRMDRRREYEEVNRQLQESSESSESFAEELFRPGTLVLLEDALSFTKIARLIVQSSPPFLALHANAAFMRLADFGSCSIVGKPISALLSVVERIPNLSKTLSGEACVDCESTSKAAAISSSKLQQNEVRSSKCTVTQNDPAEMCLDVLIASSGLNQCYAVTLTKENEGSKSRNSNNSSKGNSGCSICLMSICPVGTCKPKYASIDLKEESIPMLPTNHRCGSLGSNSSSKKRKQHLHPHLCSSHESPLINTNQAYCCSNDDITHYVIQLRPTDALADFHSHSDDTSVPSALTDPNPVAACG